MVVAGAFLFLCGFFIVAVSIMTVAFSGMGDGGPTTVSNPVIWGILLMAILFWTVGILLMFRMSWTLAPAVLSFVVTGFLLISFAMIPGMRTPIFIALFSLSIIADICLLAFRNKK